jgi:sugar lactone lactonase YvrE
MDNAISTVVDERFDLSENPVWDGTRNRLLWCDINAGAIHALDLASRERSVWTFDGPVCSFGLCLSGRFVVALADSVVLFDPAMEDTVTLATIRHARSEMRLNDGKVGPDGAFWVGSMDERSVKEPIASLYRVTGDGAATEITGGLLVSNGLAWSADGGVMYHADSRGPWIDRWRFDPETGTASKRSRLVTLDEATGRPDGGACDAEGYYWSAGVSAARLNRFAPDGTLAASIDLPVARPTMPCFGGDDLSTLFVTSLSNGMSAEALARYPLSGSVLTLPSPVAGAPVHRFRD